MEWKDEGCRCPGHWLRRNSFPVLHGEVILGDAPRTPLKDLTQHAPCGGGRKSSVRAVLWHRSGAGAGAFQAPLARGQRLSGTRGQRRERPSKLRPGYWRLDTGAGDNPFQKLKRKIMTDRKYPLLTRSLVSCMNL